MKLYFAPDSRAVRVAWLLEELGLEYELERFKLGDRAMREETYRKVHPIGRVPALEDGDVHLFESGAIVEYLLVRHGNGRLRPAEDSADFPDYLQWLHYCEGMIMPQINVIMVETVFLPPERMSETHVKRARKLLDQMLSAVDAHLANRTFLAGAFSAADVMTGHAVISAARLGADMSALPNLPPYIARLESRAAYQRAKAL